MTVDVVPAGDAEAGVWSTAFAVAHLLAELPWVLVGAQMVMLLEREAGRSSGRTTGDVDAMVDVRATASATRVAAERLVQAGFVPDGWPHPYRFHRGHELVPLLASDHLGPRVDLTTVPPARTTGIPCGSRALATRRHLDLRVVGGRQGCLPVASCSRSVHLRHGRRCGTRRVSCGCSPPFRTSTRSASSSSPMNGDHWR